jgi:DNA repair protein RadC
MACRPKIPMLGNPPSKKIRAQKVVAKTVKEQAPAFDRGFIVSTSRDLVRDLGEYLDLTNEVYIAIFLNMRNKVVGYTEFTSGSISSVEVHPAGIFQAALLAGAAGMVTVHNHPSGDPSPSNDDRALWRRLRDAGDLMGIPVIDNLVIGDGGRYFSEFEEGSR